MIDNKERNRIVRAVQALNRAHREQAHAQAHGVYKIMHDRAIEKAQARFIEVLDDLHGPSTKSWQ